VAIVITSQPFITVTKRLLETESFFRICKFKLSESKTYHLLWNPNIHDRVHKSPPMVPILSEMHPVHTLPDSFPKIHSNIIFLTTHTSSEWSLPFKYSDQSFVCIYLSRECYIPRPSRPPWFCHPNNIWWSVRVIKLLTAQSSPASRKFLPLRSEYSQHSVFSHH